LKMTMSAALPSEKVLGALVTYGIEDVVKNCRAQTSGGPSVEGLDAEFFGHLHDKPSHQRSDGHAALAGDTLQPVPLGAAGLKRFFNGRTCCRGHVAERYASSGACVECIDVLVRGAPNFAERNREKALRSGAGET
jgi:hypothetical protein